MSMAGRVIVHVDMDAFFAAVEQRERPELRGKPIIIGHPGRRGVVATCSYEARKFGIRSAMPSVQAERLCPHATWVSGRRSLYVEVSREVFAIFERHAPVIEPVSVDEAYLDLTGVAADLDAGARIAGEIRAAIRSEQRLTASAGIGPNRFLAKVASDLDKPDGQVLLSLERVPELLWPLPVRVIPGCGPKLAGKLAQMGVETVSQLARVPEQELRRRFGTATGLWLHDRARGIDDTPLATEHARKSISEERTYREDLVTAEQVHREVLDRAEGVARVCRRKGVLAKTVTLKVRDNTYRTLTRSKTLAEPTDLATEIFEAAMSLLAERVQLNGRGIRLLGVGVEHLVPASEVPPRLFPDEEREKARRAAQASDLVLQRFGRNALKRAALMRDPEAGDKPSEEPSR